MKLLNFLKNITRLVGGTDIHSTSSAEEASHLMTALGGSSSISIEDDDLDDAQKIAAFSEILKYNSKVLNMGVLPPNCCATSQEIQERYNITVTATTLIAPVVTLQGLEMKALSVQLDTDSEKVWEIPKLLPPASASGVLVPGVNICGNMIRTYAPMHLSSVSGSYDIDLAGLNVSANLIVDTAELEPDVEYNFYMFYKFEFNAAGREAQYYGAAELNNGLTVSDFVGNGPYGVSVFILDEELLNRFDSPTPDGFENVQVEFYFIITDSAGTLDDFVPES